VVTQSQKNLIGVGASNGELLWSVPFTTPYVQNIVTPVLYKDVLIFSGLEKGTIALRVERAGDRWATRKVWENPDASFYMSSPVIYRDFLVGLSHKRRGQFVCLDARTGVTAWSSAGRDAENAAVLVAGDKVLFLIDTGELIVADPAAKAFTPVRRYAVSKSATWAHPAIAAKVILVKDSDSLSAWSAE
jgi:outer membrane protein assembly factor BamB